MTDETKKQIAELADKWIEPGNENRRSQKKLSVKIGISDATLSNMRKGKWTSISNAIWNKAGSYFTTIGWLKKGLDDGWRYWDFTPEHEIIRDVILNAQTESRNAAIDGPTRKGKSEAIKNIVNKDRSNEMFHIIGRRSMNPKTLCITIAEEIGLTTISSNRYDLEKDIAEKLMEMEKPCLIFDELETVSLTCFSVIKTLLDITDGQVGIVLVGIDLWDLVHFNATKKKDAFRQIQGRFPVHSYEFLPEGLEPKTLTKILDNCGITNKYAQQWFEENVFDYDALKNTVKDAMRIARANNIKEIDREFLAELFSPKPRKSFRLKRAA
jgi:DNA transposition AAA+ family ATPase